MQWFRRFCSVVGDFQHLFRTIRNSYNGLLAGQKNRSSLRLLYFLTSYWVSPFKLSARLTRTLSRFNALFERARSRLSYRALSCVSNFMFSPNLIEGSYKCVWFLVLPPRKRMLPKSALFNRARDQQMNLLSPFPFWNCMRCLRVCEKETKRTPIPCYTLSIQKILQSCIQYVFSVHLCIHQKNMKQEQNRYVDRFFTGWL